MSELRMQSRLAARSAAIPASLFVRFGASLLHGLVVNPLPTAHQGSRNRDRIDRRVRRGPMMEALS